MFLVLYRIPPKIDKEIYKKNKIRQFGLKFMILFFVHIPPTFYSQIITLFYFILLFNKC